MRASSGGGSGGSFGGSSGGGGGGDGDDGKDGQPQKPTGGFRWKGWEDRVAADPQFAYKVFIEQVCICACAPSWVDAVYRCDGLHCLLLSRFIA